MYFDRGERILIPKSLVITGLLILAIHISIIIIINILNIFKILSNDILRISEILFSTVFIILMFYSWKYVFGKRYKEYEGLSKREQELFEDNNWLKEEREILKKFAGFQSKTLSKIIFLSILCLWVGSILYIFSIIFDNKIFDLTQSRIIFHMIYFFFAITLLGIGYGYLLYGKKSVEFCLNCDRIKIGNSWRHLTKFGNFSHSLCDVCASALISKHTKKAGDMMGHLLVKKGIINAIQLKKALDIQKKLREKSIGEILQEENIIDEDTLNKALKEQMYLMENGNSKK